MPARRSLQRRNRRPSSTGLYRASDFRRAVPIERPDSDLAHQAARSEFRRDYARLIHSPAFRRLQGKTQLFPGVESEFFRNRLTHSIEVAQIAKGIALWLNTTSRLKKSEQVDTDLVEFAGLAHDLGHPPFGHNGEEALDELMRGSGGFEGNAQTLRILAKLEKKLDNLDRQRDSSERVLWFSRGEEVAVGLNLCSRSLASVLKYDCQIPMEVERSRSIAKGFYFSERDVAARIKKDVCGRAGSTQLKTIECQIMDLADDIAYSTYDLEDAFKARLLDPIGILGLPTAKLERVAEKVSDELKRELKGARLDAGDVQEVLRELLQRDVMDGAGYPQDAQGFATALQRATESSGLMVSSGYYRTMFTSALVNRFVRAVSLEYDAASPYASLVHMVQARRIEVSILKQLTFVAIIETHHLQLLSARARSIINSIFEALNDRDHKCFRLLPPDFADRFDQAGGDEVAERRVICDFISGMTDRHAVEFYGRLVSPTFQSMFKPH